MLFRKAATVEAGITKRFSTKDTEVLEYCPLNGTRYPIVLTKLSPAQCQLFGYGEGCCMVTIQRFVPDERFLSRPMYTDGRTIFVQEIMEWFDYSSFNDACCIAELLGQMLGCPTNADEMAEHCVRLGP